MIENDKLSGSDLAFIDAYENTAADYDEIPELTEAELARGVWHIEGRVVDEAEGRAAMAAALRASRERVELDLPGDVVVAFRAAGPDWRERMAEALRKAASL